MLRALALMLTAVALVCALVFVVYAAGFKSGFAAGAYLITYIEGSL